MRPSHIAWRGKRFLNAPTANEPVANYGVTQPCEISPRSYAHCFSIKREQMIPSRVPHLLFLRSPIAVLLRIAFVVISALKRVSGRSRPHIRVKRCEPVRPHPFIANADTSRAVVVKLVGAFISASLYHCVPQAVSVDVGHAVGCVVSTNLFGVVASAGFVFSPLKIIGLSKNNTSAFAHAPKSKSSPSGWLGHSKHGESVKFKTYHIVKTIASWSDGWKAFGRFFHNLSMTGFSECRSVIRSAFAFSTCQFSVFNARGI